MASKARVQRGSLDADPRVLRGVLLSGILVRVFVLDLQEGCFGGGERKSQPSRIKPPIGVRGKPRHRSAVFLLVNLFGIIYSLFNIHYSIFYL